MGPKAVVAGRDSESSDEVVEDGKEECLPLQRGDHCSNEANDRGEDENGDVE